MKPNVYSEIGVLRSVIVHRPGEELDNLTPDAMETLLFDELPYLEEAQREHDQFAQVMRQEGIEVYYLEDLMVESLINDQVINEFIDEFIEEGRIPSGDEEKKLKDYLLSIKNKKEMVLKTMAGVRTSELGLDVERLFVVLPMPNLYFTRDPFAFIGESVCENKMWSVTRNRETIYSKYIFKYHPEFKEVKKVYDRNEEYSIEGGDVLVLSRQVLCVGISQRTKREAVLKFAENTLRTTEFKKVLALTIPDKREFMHLDTVFTMIDKDLFTIHPEIHGPMKVYSITLENDEIEIVEEVDELEKILASSLNVDGVELIPCGGSNPIDQKREQWNDGSNTLAIAPRKVIVYDRNKVTNKLLEEAGVELIKIKSGEISRGRGGPRCMSMPLEREELI